MRLRALAMHTALALIACAGCSQAPTLEHARQLAEQAAQGITRAQSLLAAGNAEEANAAAEAANRALRQARAEYLAAKADRSRDVDVLVEFAEFAERLEDYDLAGESFARAAGFAESRADLWYRAARSFVLARGRYLDRVADALAEAERLNATSEAPVPSADIAAIRGDLFMALGLPEDAATHYANALAMDPQHARARIGAAGAALELGDAARAATLADSFTTPTPSEAAVLDRTLRASYLDFRRDRAIVPETAEAQQALAKLSVRLGFMQEARLAIDRAVQLGADDVFSWNLLGSLSAQTGNTERAREAFQRSLQLEPDQPRTREALDALSVPAN